MEYGQKNITTLQRNLLNSDEILRIPLNQLLVNIRGNKPLLLDKMIYTEHPLSKKLRDVPINEYRPNWNKENCNMIMQEKLASKEMKKEQKMESKEEMSFDIF